MRVVVPSYVYTLIKISALKAISISPAEYRALGRIKEVPELLMSLERFFPGISDLRGENLNLIEIEKKLFQIYFKIYEKILISSPDMMQNFLKSLLVRFEIWNIKTYLMGMLANVDLDHIREEILIEPEKILQRINFIDQLLKRTNFQDGIKYLKTTRYAKIVERGMYYFDQKKEVFLLEALLDKYFVTQTLGSLSNYAGLEQDLFDDYIDILVQKYNLTLIYRCIRNKVPLDLLKQLVLPKGSIFNKKILEYLVAAKTIKDFYEIVSEVVKTKPILHSALKNLSPENPIKPILSIFNKRVFQIVPVRAGMDLETRTIEKVLMFIFNKENEIFKVLALFVKLLYEIH